jgi:hypothetical protein
MTAGRDFGNVKAPKNCPEFESGEGAFFSSETKHARRKAPRAKLPVCFIKQITETKVTTLTN